ncbi:MAG: TIR domain-containing protein, partial [Alphaproteobacteria bacterium]|nr:TIR domain-containing protein [Alphaproteobacteria bacterium]
MASGEHRIFISYSRHDGGDVAARLKKALRNSKLAVWHDIEEMISGDNVLPQVLEAIEKAEHLILILTPRALASDWVKREWSHARAKGVMISPILADPTIDKKSLPRWIQSVDLCDPNQPERWTRLLRVLEDKGRVRRVPDMTPPAIDLVARPAEFERIKQAILAPPAGPVGITTALRGGGGFGKTMLANALCHDEDIRLDFPDGLLHVSLGKEGRSPIALINDLIKLLTGDRPGFEDANVAAAQLAQAIGEARLLLVIDDVWSRGDLEPFLRGGPNCVRLVTTRNIAVLPPGSVTVTVDSMTGDESVAVLARGLKPDPALAARLAALAERLGHWAQLLAMANGWLLGRVTDGESLGDSLEKFERRLTARGLTAFDPKNEKERERSIRLCIEASLEDLPATDAARLAELAVLPEDEPTPLAVIEALWAETGGLDDLEADDLYRAFAAASLTQPLDLGARTLLLHDNMLWYLRERLGPDGLPA